MGHGPYSELRLASSVSSHLLAFAPCLAPGLGAFFIGKVFLEYIGHRVIGYLFVTPTDR